jgi:hypothetical protein
VTTAEELIGRARKLGIHLWVSDGMLNFKAPRAAISAELRTELQAHKASLIDALSGPSYHLAPEVGAVDVPEAYVSTWNQVRTGVIGTCYTNLTNLLCRYRFPLDLQALERGLHSLVRQHNALRCRLSDDEPGFRLVFDCSPELTTVDLSGCDLSALDSAIIKAAQDIAWAPFALGTCLFKPYVLKLPSSEVAVGFVVHHFIVDGWSFGRILLYWMMEYDKQFPQHPQEENSQGYLQYSEFLLGVANWSKTRNFQRRLDYWKETLRGVVPSRLPPDRALDYDARSPHGGQSFRIDAERVKRLIELAASLGVTLSDVLLAGVVIALQRELKISDICLRHLWHGRDQPKLFDMIGSTVTPIILRVHSSPASRLGDVAQQVHRVALEAIANHVPCYYVDKTLNETSTTAFVQTNFVLEDHAADVVRENETVLPSVEPIDVWNPHGWFATRSFLQAHDVNIVVVSGAICGNVVYLQNVYDAETIERFIDGFQRALEH